MMGHPNQYPRIDAKQLLPFTANGVLYRAFDRLIAAKNGSVLLVPLYLVHGDLSALVDGCPIPWEEVDEVMHTACGAVHAFDVDADAYSPLVHGVAALTGGGWLLDFVSINRSQHLVWRLAHASGVRFACTADLVYAGPTGRRFLGAGELERSGYIPAGSAAEREK